VRQDAGADVGTFAQHGLEQTRPFRALKTWVTPGDCSYDQLEAINRALPEPVQATGRAFVTGTVYRGRETLRACILHPGTTQADLATLLAEVPTAADDLRRGPAVIRATA
jgi:hypothetical protein